MGNPENMGTGNAPLEENMTNQKPVIDQARNMQTELVEVRRHLHAHPELSYQEIETAKFAADRLTGLDFKVKKNVGKTGLIADFGKEEAARIAIRADMDALPIEEAPTHAHHSQNQGVMHACGHDAHVSCALGAAKILSGSTNNIRMIMQPAEEAGDSQGRSGAYRMIEDNALDGVDAIIGLHMDASLPAGKVGIAPGPVMAAADPFMITIEGKGGHGAFPEDTIDAVVLATQVVQAIQQIVSRRISGLESAIITIGSFQSSSTRGNIISDHVILRGTFRSFNKVVRQTILDELDKACSIARILGGNYKIEYEHGYPATVNDPTIAGIMRQAAIDLIGEENVITLPPKPWSEDFSMFAEIVPGTFMFLGAEIKDDRRTHHTANFDLDESGLYIGSAILAETARRLGDTIKKDG
jgi:amidohydrolase